MLLESTSISYISRKLGDNWFFYMDNINNMSEFPRISSQHRRN